MYYAIGDIHGRLDLLEKLYNKILDDIEKVKDPFGNFIIFLGDLIDRGPRSIGVIKFLMNLEDSPEITHIFIKGNHEEMLIEAFDNPKNVVNLRVWHDNGGETLLKEVGLTIRDMTADNYNSRIIVNEVEWLRNVLVNYHETIDYLFVHAGIDRMRKASEVQPEMLRWGRFVAKDYYKEYNRMVIHGHTPQKGKPLVDMNRINVDVGSPWSNTLCCAVLSHVRATGEPRFISVKSAYKAL